MPTTATGANENFLSYVSNSQSETEKKKRKEKEKKRNVKGKRMGENVEKKRVKEMHTWLREM